MVIVFVLLFLIIIFFSLDMFPPDSIILISLIVLVVTEILTPLEAFSGFGSDFIIMLTSIFIISAALQHNGVIDIMANKLAGVFKQNYFLTILIMMLSTGVLSAFMNNTTIASVMLLPILEMCRRTNQAPSHFLMPMAFASIIGGTCTIIGTSTNVVGNNFIIENGLDPLGFFELLPFGIVLLVFCALFFSIFGKKILHDNGFNESINNNSRIYHTQIIVTNENFLQRLTIREITNSDLKILKVTRKKDEISFDNDYMLQLHDTLIMEGSRDSLTIFYKKYNLISSEIHESIVAEIIVLPSSFISNSTISDSDFENKTGVSVIGLYRKGHRFTSKWDDIIIKTGDILIVEGIREEIKKISFFHFLILTKIEKQAFPDIKKGIIALIIFGLAIIISSIGLIPMSIAFLSAALLGLSFKVLPADVAYSKIDWRLVVLIGGMSAFGEAFQKTGGASYLAQLVVEIFSNTSHFWVLFAFMLLTVLLTQPMSNAAAALVILPVALEWNCNKKLDNILSFV